MPLIEVTPRRHAFAKKHRPVLFALSGFAVFAAAVFILPHVTLNLIKAALLPGVLCLLYFVIFRFIKQSGETSFPAKELVIGFCFAIGVMVATVTSFLTPFGLALGGALATLFAANCLIIGRAESEFDRQFDAASFFGKSHRGNWIPVALLLVSISLASVIFVQGLVPLLGGVVLGCSLLQLACRRWAGAGLMQPLADGVLLFPWIMLHYLG